MNISAQALRDYSECASIYKGNSSNKNTDFIEMIVFGCLTDKLNKFSINIFLQINHIFLNYQFSLLQN